MNCCLGNESERCPPARLTACPMIVKDKVAVATTDDDSREKTLEEDDDDDDDDRSVRTKAEENDVGEESDHDTNSVNS
jgi:hypothetical protein